jgi:hypothetical protein
MTSIGVHRVLAPNGPAMLHARAHMPNALVVAEIVQAGIGLRVPLVLR